MTQHPPVDHSQLSELAQLAELPEKNPEPVLRTDREGVLLLGNAAARELFGTRRWSEDCWRWSSRAASAWCTATSPPCRHPAVIEPWAPEAGVRTRMWSRAGSFVVAIRGGQLDEGGRRLELRAVAPCQLARAVDEASRAAVVAVDVLQHATGPGREADALQ